MNFRKPKTKYIKGFDDPEPRLLQYGSDQASRRGYEVSFHTHLNTFRDFQIANLRTPQATTATSLT